VQCRITGAECTALADPEDIDLIDAVTLPQEIDAVVQVAVNVIVYGEVLVRRGGIAPLDQVGVQALVDEIAHHGTVRLQIGYQVAVHQCIDDQQRSLEQILLRRQIMIELELVFRVHRFLGCGTYVHVLVPELAQEIETLGDLFVNPLQLFDGVLGLNVDGQ
jgi:hypothetical protein